jgi:DNA-binding NarL/FixJ family response regulator
MSNPPPTTPPDAWRRRVYVIEDHPLMRRSIVEAIEREPDLMVCAQADDAPGVPEIEMLEPDVVLTDLQLRTTSGLDLIRNIRARLPRLGIVATTMFDVRRNERLARAAGATAFAGKGDGPERLIAVLREALEATLPAR